MNVVQYKGLHVVKAQIVYNQITDKKFLRVKCSPNKATKIVAGLYAIDNNIDYTREYKEDTNVVMEFDVQKCEIPWPILINIVEYIAVYV